jgi:ubiquitin-protein ligase
MNDRQIKKWPKTIMKKYMKAMNNKDFKIVQAVEDNLDIFYILLEPTGGHYAGQKHILEFKTRYGSPLKYFPFKCPLVKFMTNIYHPNVSSSGSICVDIFTQPDKWSPSYDFNAVMTSIILLLDTPNNASPYNGLAANLFRRCEKKYSTETKGVKMSYQERDIIFNKSFDSYDKAASKHSNTNKHVLSKYMKYFEIDDLTNEVGELSVESHEEKKEE